MGGAGTGEVQEGGRNTNCCTTKCFPTCGCSPAGPAAAGSAVWEEASARFTFLATAWAASNGQEHRAAAARAAAAGRRPGARPAHSRRPQLTRPSSSPTSSASSCALAAICCPNCCRLPKAWFHIAEGRDQPRHCCWLVASCERRCCCAQRLLTTSLPPTTPLQRTQHCQRAPSRSARHSAIAEHATGCEWRPPPAHAPDRALAPCKFDRGAAACSAPAHFPDDTMHSCLNSLPIGCSGSRVDRARPRSHSAAAPLLNRLALAWPACLASLPSQCETCMSPCVCSGP